jgi:cytidylate kinase
MRFLKRLIIPGTYPITEIPEWTILYEDEPMERMCIQSQKEYLKFIQSTIEHLWQRGNVVIVGRGGQIILRDKKDVFHVRIIASMESRLELLMKQTGLDETPAMKLIRKNDKRQANYIKYCYQEDWDNPSLYHLIVNAGELGVEFAAKFIADAALNFVEREMFLNDYQNLDFRSLEDFGSLR